MATTVPVLGKGNIKVGPVLTFSLPAKFTCPGATTWCLKHCYAYRFERRRPNCRRAYAHNLVLTWKEGGLLRAMLEALPPRAPYMRVHVSGDFYSEDYVHDWIAICRTWPYTRFWAYTRSWVVPSLRKSLERLRAQNNMQIFASVDPTMPLPPAGWRIAFIEGDERAVGIHCPEQHGASTSCLSCGYCFRRQSGDVIFKVH